MPDHPQDQPEEYSPEETQRRLDRALKRSMEMPSRGQKSKDSAKKNRGAIQSKADAKEN